MAKRGQDFSENQLADLWYRYIPYWPVLVGLIVVSVAAGWYYLENQVRYYSATGSVSIKERQFNDAAQQNQQAALNSLDKESELLKSKDLMGSVIKTLGLYAPVYQEGRFITQTAYSTSPIKIDVFAPDSIQSVNRVDFNLQGDKVIAAGNTYPVNNWVNTPWGKLRFTTRPDVQYNPKANLWFQLTKPEDLAGGLAARLGVNGQASIIYVSLIDESPRRAEDIVNELMAQYCKKHIEEKKLLVTNTLNFVDEELRDVKAQLDSVEHRVQSVKASTGMDITSKGSMLMGNLNTNDQKLSDIDLQLNVLDKLQSYVVNHDQTGGLAPSTLGLSDASLSELIAKFSNAQLEAEKTKKRSGENNPEMTGLRVELEKLGNLILENIQSQKQNLLASQSSLRASNGRYNAQLSSLPGRERDLIDVNRQQSIKNNIYTFLLQRKEDAKLALESLIADNKILDRAFAGNAPVSPNSKKTYAIAVLLALFVWIGGISLREMLASKVLFRTDIEKYTKIPILAEISYTRKRQLMTELQNTKFAYVAEQFRKLRTSLSFLGLGVKRKKIVVTSSIPGEGKSFITANLGLSLALAGKKVALLEFDLMNPTLGKKLNIDHELGLSNYLVGNQTLEEIVVPVEGTEGLDFYPAGHLPDQPSELIAGDKVPELFRILEERYDYVIIDTPPVGPISDAYILSSYADATLYVVRHKYTPKSFVKRLDYEMGINPLKNPVIVMNAVQSRGFSKSYGTGYGYSYNYTYNYRQNANRPRLEIKKG